MKLQAEAVARELKNCYELPVRHIDVSLRGYALIHEDRFLYIKPSEVRGDMERAFTRLDSLLRVQQYDDPKGWEQLKAMKQAMREYATFHESMIKLIKQDNMQDFLAEFSKDKGFSLWKVYEKLLITINAFEEKRLQKAEQEYANANSTNLYIQILLTLIGIPSILFVIQRLRKEGTQRFQLLTDLDTNNRKYLFDPGTALNTNEAHKSIEHSIDNIKKASSFVKQISQGNYNVDWQGLTQQNIHLNQSNLAGELLQMREQMKKLKAEEEKRNWTNEGLARFSEIVRNHQHHIEKLSYEVISFLTKYINAQQGSLFVVQGTEKDVYLELTACYAFDRKKFVQKQIPAGTGLLGQTYLEGESILLTDIPQGYIEITSGLGDATPGCLVIVPMRYNDQVEALIELAGFNQFEEYQVRFLEKAGEFMASAITNAKTAMRTEKLLQESQEQAEMLKSQEEELRQNMEELAATQEEMFRKERELEARLKSIENISR
ncbi:GAF domain-containing protein [Cytophagaceae bacterium DM2B3-1]|uniref:GAF domain-containing protein n=1 Tax=Xanthocytophaga flava TaxID=3048013 RepID=A0ABT7CQG9_9BACT|nr:GAF domain-containing protein [Xanthocytophaga flavus]MDJ1495988.1 GAF domain-containing protein [Xanthocytophaga flavus]